MHGDYKSGQTKTYYLSEREKAIIQLMVENPIVTRTDMAEKLQCSLSTIKRCITGLTEKGIIERVGSDKTGSWIVK
ncbi:winged helix-turn-helix transcriptional regulator [Butyrivibrio sp. MC2021]|uniref:winged helix-turn-helix transcriptional regulator n=1 Tax=Butyrivibrio sp. MC2021 TaxID=1408306 RepID=UPI0012DC6F60